MFSTLEANGSSVSSGIGRASISSRIATVLPGFPPRMMPTTPVFKPISTISIPRSFSFSLINSVVLYSALLTSGFSWRYLRVAIISSTYFSTSFIVSISKYLLIEKDYFKKSLVNCTRTAAPVGILSSSNSFLELWMPCCVFGFASLPVPRRNCAPGAYSGNR